ncbi:MAG: phosphoglycerate kinase [bacterium]|nr:phosphoglycerate kinase [bacterium]
MMKYLSSLKSQYLKGKICILRLDFNTEDNWRMEASLPTLKFLIKNCRAVVILSHKGRPRGFEEKLSLRNSAKDLKKALKKQVIFVPHFRFQEIKNLIDSVPKGSIFLLENLRFLEGEEQNNSVLAEHLASLGNFYVNDAFAVSHRANASVAAITEFLPSYAGLELETELKNLSQAIKNPGKPFVIILGGLKIKDKLEVYHNLKNKVDKFLIGGALTTEMLNMKFWDPKLKTKNLIMPLDFKLDKAVIHDIGPESVKLFKEKIKMAKTIIWNGPLGDIRQKKFSNGTKEIAKAMSANTTAFKIIGGGETVMFFKKMKLDKKINFVSTGGGAMLDFLAGKKLPGIEALK